MRFVTTQFTEGATRTNEDRLTVCAHSDGALLVLADGAGGTGSGALAANTIVEWMRRRQLVEIGDQDACRRELYELDAHLMRNCSGGQSTAVIVVVRDDRLFGASIGDSECWFVTGDSVDELTEQQTKKPLLGSGMATPHGVTRSIGPGTLIMGSDGLFKYSRRSLIIGATRRATVEEVAAELAGLPRLSNGGLQDDLSFIVCRIS